ncbi:MAG TPA: condensation domain-containing protein, partial [Thermoanaerobaculia bacterium]|nr:condensation domain-containing protein [Thermoanaerobaculia bacterium]
GRPRRVGLRQGAAFLFLAAMPLTANGKLDRRALPEPDPPRPAASALPAAARTPLEELLCEIWEEVLGVPRVGGGDNFFDLGGHSLLAMQLASRIRESFAVELPLRDLFEAPTVAAVAARIESLRRREGSRPAPPITRVERDQAPVLSFAQERLWFFGQVQPDSPIFNMALAVRLEGELAAGALERSLREVVRRHEVLRTTFPTIDGLPVQRIAAAGAVALPVVDLGAIAEPAAAEARRLYLEEGRQPFDLAAGPLLRPLLLRLAPRRHELLVTLHHIVSDGWSLGLLVRELGALYPAFAAGGSSPLPDLPFQYLDYAVWQRRRLEGELLENQVSYWRSHLRGAPTVLEVETDRPRPPAQSFRGAIRAFSLDGGLTRDLEALSRASGCTLYMTLLAAFQTLIHAYTGRDDLLVGSPVANRNRLEIEGLIGLFVNMLVLRATFADNPTFRLLLARTREATLGAYVHQDLPFDKLVQELRPVRDAGRPPIFQVIFAYQQNPSWDLELPGLTVEILPPAEVVARYDLHLSMVRQGEGLEGYLTYNADLYDAATAGVMLDRFAALLREAAAHPDERIDRLAQTASSSEIRRNRAMERKSADAAQRERLFSIKRPKGVSAAAPLVRTRPIAPGRRLPLLAEPAVQEVDLASWAAGQGELLRQLLATEGAILFRGFEVESIERFREVATAIAPDLIGYEDPSTPRTEVKEKVYTSTEYPPEQSIQLHNELSYNHAWPMKIFFFCVTPAAAGGETPLADSRRLYQRIAPEVRERFAAKGVMYVRNFGEGFGLPWQKVFQTTEKSRVEEYCRERGMTFEWRDRDRLRTRHVRPAVARHPATGEMVWFNQANVHHPSSLPAALRESLLAVVEDRDFPLDMNACFGDGSLIPDADIAAIRRAYDEETVMFPWQRGDLLLADNMLVAHGRSSFSGPRQIVVLMAETMTDAGR